MVGIYLSVWVHADLAPHISEERATVGVADADHVLLVGDLNYRLNLEDLEARRAMATGNWRRLRQADQLAGEMAEGRAFPGWEEGELTFRPTYKFRRGTDE